VQHATVYVSAMRQLRSVDHTTSVVWYVLAVMWTYLYPQWLAKKQAAINVKNSDNRCFLWSILSAMFPARHNPDRITHYKTHENAINTTRITFLVDVRDVLKFEALSPTISVNVLCTGDKGWYVPLYMSKHRNRTHQINLFLLEGKDEEGNTRKHYVWIKNMSRLVEDEQTMGIKHSCFSLVFTCFVIGKVSSVTYQTVSDIPHNMCNSPTRKFQKSASLNIEMNRLVFSYRFNWWQTLRRT